MAFESYDPNIIVELHKQIKFVDDKPKLPDWACGDWGDTRATLIGIKQIDPLVAHLIDELVEAGDRTDASST